METADHLFLGCNLFGSVWYLICSWLGISYVPSRLLTDHFLQFSNLAGMPRSSHTYFKVIWLASIWAIWKDRNNYIFKNAVLDPQIILEKVKWDSFLWLSSNLPIAQGMPKKLPKIHKVRLSKPKTTKQLADIQTSKKARPPTSSPKNKRDFLAFSHPRDNAITLSNNLGMELTELLNIRLFRSFYTTQAKRSHMS
ncbi:transmembrane protein, putative [Medicago truncatula]|uniref:Transmembrane protein, putative n=1 Tax=Medicago truncatula TaxID=3880 RepID=A0A072UIE2_MEDTR|nr:transmembrane protein, putative [Medicago truncatula]